MSLTGLISITAVCVVFIPGHFIDYQPWVKDLSWANQFGQGGLTAC